MTGPARFTYRAVMADGSLATGELTAPDEAAAMLALRGKGARPIQVQREAQAAPAARRRSTTRSRAAAVALTGDLAVLLKAGLPIDRALALAIGNVEDKAMAAQFGAMLAEVREGAALSQAMARRPALFPPAAAALAEAGEASGALADAMTRLADMLERAAELRRTVSSAMIYPVSLALIAIGVILLMLLFVVPQFESLFGQAQDRLPAASLAVMAASRFLREWGLGLLAGLIMAGLAAKGMLARPAARGALDRLVLALPRIGALVRNLEAARFARTLGALVQGNVPLPAALAMARRTVANSAIGDAIGRVADGLREGGGLAAPLAEARVLPPIAIGFLRTGEESSQLGPMLLRLAEVLDRDVRIGLERLIATLTPLITILLGASVAAIIAAIMSAILGFNELAITP